MKLFKDCKVWDIYPGTIYFDTNNGVGVGDLIYKNFEELSKQLSEYLSKFEYIESEDDKNV